MSKTHIILSIAGTDFTFKPTVQDHNNYTNEMMPDNKVAPMYTFLSRTVEPEQKEALQEIMNTVPGVVMEIFSTVTKAAKGGIEITLKS